MNVSCGIIVVAILYQGSITKPLGVSFYCVQSEAYNEGKQCTHIVHVSCGITFVIAMHYTMHNIIQQYVMLPPSAMNFAGIIPLFKVGPPLQNVLNVSIVHSTMVNKHGGLMLIEIYFMFGIG